MKRFILGQDTENKKIEIKGMLGYSIIEIGKIELECISRLVIIVIALK